MQWAEMTDPQRGEAIRSGYLAGKSSSQVAKPLGTTKNAVLGWAWRHYLTAANASKWQYGPKRVSYTPPRPGSRKPAMPMALKRQKLGNRAMDPETRKFVDQINALPLRDEDIESELEIFYPAITRWRGGQWVPSLPQRQRLQEVLPRLAIELGR